MGTMPHVFIVLKKIDFYTGSIEDVFLERDKAEDYINKKEEKEQFEIIMKAVH